MIEHGDKIEIVWIHNCDLPEKYTFYSKQDGLWLLLGDDSQFIIVNPLNPNILFIKKVV